MAQDVKRAVLRDIKHIDWFLQIPGALYLLQGGDGGALATVVRVPVHVQNLFPVHRHDPGQDAFLRKTRMNSEHQHR